MNVKIALIVLFAFALSSCSNSIVYSPSLGLSADRLKKDEIDLSGGVAMLAETRPHLDEATSLGAYLDVGYGFSDKFGLYLSTWRDFDMSFRGGIELNSRIGLYDAESLSLEVIPRAAMLIDGNILQGYGFNVPVVLIYKYNSKLYGYTGIGPVAGSYLERYIKDEFGYGAMGHIALTYNWNNFRFGIEVSPIYFYNRYDDRTDFVVSPAINFGYIIR